MTDVRFCLLILLLPLVCYILHICYIAHTIYVLFREKHVTASFISRQYVEIYCLLQVHVYIQEEKHPTTSF